MGSVLIPQVSAGTSGYVIDFRREIFASLTEAFLRRQFDPAKAQAKLATA